MNRLSLVAIAGTTTLLAGLLTGTPAQADVIPNDDGTNTQVDQTGNDFSIMGGSTSADDQNLFHSFTEFDLLTGESATFFTDPEILNILTRVTGGNASAIDGLLQVVGSEANLFFINPSGILFGPNSALNLQGSFTATTADQVNFADGTFGSIETPDYAALVGNPTSFGFNVTGPSAIANLGELSVETGESIVLAGGQVLNTGTITAPGGDVIILAVEGENLVRIEQTGLLLNLEVETLPDDTEAPLLPFEPIALPELLTGTAIATAEAVIVNPDGSIQLTDGEPIATDVGTAIVAGTVDVANDEGGRINVTGEDVTLPSGLIDIGGTETGGNLTVDANRTLALGIVVNAAGGGQAVFDPPEFVIDEAEAGTLESVLLSDGDVTVAASETIRVDAPITVDEAIEGDRTLAFVDEDDAPETPLTIDLNAPITLGEGFVLTGEGSLVNLGDNGLFQNALNLVIIDGQVAFGEGTFTEETPIVFTQDINVTGAGVDATIFDGGGVNRVFEIGEDATVTISGVTITNGFSESSGGGIFNTGELTINDSTISGNESEVSGGGIFNDGNLTINNSAIVDNIAASEVIDTGGGGIANSGTLSVTNSLISNNTADRFGGGVLNNGGANISGTTISNNTATEDSGGGIANSVAEADSENPSSLTITNSTLSGNTAANNGGGLDNYASDVTVTNSTISGNTAANNGGGLHNFSNTLTITDSTIVLNEAALGGGIANSAVGEVILGGSLVAGNSASEDGINIFNESNFASANNNLFGVSDEAGLFGVELDDADVIPTVPLEQILDLTLADNNADLPDATTQTHALLPGSPGIDQGGSSTTDQRGVEVVGDRRDIGAFESRGFDVSFNEGASPTLTVGEAFADLAVTISSPFGEPVTDGTVNFNVETDESGAGATLDNTTAIIDEAGQASVSGAANVTVGDYTIAVNTSGALEEAIFNLSNTLFSEFVVDTLADEDDSDLSAGDLSLREAISFTETGGTISFAPDLIGGTITLGGSELVVDRSLTIDGPGADNLAVSGNGSSRVFNITGDGTEAIIQNLTITGGSAESGAGILVQDDSSLSLIGTTVTGNAARLDGGGIASEGTLTISNSDITDNIAQGSGGGIANIGFLDVSDSLIADNRADIGGGIRNDETGDATVSNSDIRGNDADFGGGISNTAGNLAIRDNTTISFNTADRGGGVENFFGNLAVSDSAISENAADSGGGLANISGDFTLNGSTIADNTADDIFDDRAPVDDDPNNHTEEPEEETIVNESEDDLGETASGEPDILDTSELDPDDGAGADASGADGSGPDESGPDESGPDDSGPDESDPDEPDSNESTSEDIDNAELEPPVVEEIAYEEWVAEDAAYAEEYTAYFDLPIVPEATLASQQTTLQSLAGVVGAPPALIYTNFIPASAAESGSSAANNQRAAQPTDVLELILVTPDAPSKRIVIREATRSKMTTLVQRLQIELTDRTRRRRTTYLSYSQQLYSWLIEPLEAELAQAKISHVSFIMASGLRSLPLAALHDGEQFIIENYTVGLMPSLALTDTRYTDIRRAPVLAMGASEFADLPDLPAVPLELATIVEKLRDGEKVLDDSFTPQELVSLRRTNSYPILHLATHGQFRAGGPSNSFIQFANQRLGLHELKQLQLNDPPLELLVMSACRTALGDSTAELGFAGLAVQAGVKSALASLWQVSDLETAGLMAEFYTQLNQQPYKAEALRQAQLAMLRGDVQIKDGNLVWNGGTQPLPPELANLNLEDSSHPYFWSAFTIVGNPW